MVRLILILGLLFSFGCYDSNKITHGDLNKLCLSFFKSGCLLGSNGDFNKCDKLLEKVKLQLENTND